MAKSCHWLRASSSNRNGNDIALNESNVKYNGWNDMICWITESVWISIIYQFISTNQLDWFCSIFGTVVFFCFMSNSKYSLPVLAFHCCDMFVVLSSTSLSSDFYWEDFAPLNLNQPRSAHLAYRKTSNRSNFLNTSQTRALGWCSNGHRASVWSFMVFSLCYFYFIFCLAVTVYLFFKYI